jgi:hypothetical protein
LRQRVNEGFDDAKGLHELCDFEYFANVRLVGRDHDTECDPAEGETTSGLEKGVESAGVEEADLG